MLKTKPFFILDQIGELNVEKILVYYEGPQLLICSDYGGKYYLIECAETQEEYTRWIMAQIKKHVAEKVAAGVYPIYEAMAGAENGNVWVVIKDTETKNDTMVKVAFNEIPKIELPDPGVCI